MPRKSKLKKGSTGNDFVLTQLSAKKTVRVDFDQQQQLFASDKILKQHSMVPKFNNDAHYYTPAFVNGVDEAGSEDFRLQQKYLHNARVKHQLSWIDSQEIKRGRPFEKNGYCFVCRKKFSDYFDHLGQDSHRDKMNSSDYNQHIMELCSLFSEKQANKTELPQTFENNVEVKPRKMLKKDKGCESLHEELFLETKKFLEGKKEDLAQSVSSEQELWNMCGFAS